VSMLKRMEFVVRYILMFDGFGRVCHKLFDVLDFHRIVNLCTHTGNDNGNDNGNGGE
jgi:hypothetical protein